MAKEVKTPVQIKKSALVQLKNSGYTIKMIAEHFSTPDKKISVVSIKKLLKLAGIPTSRGANVALDLIDDTVAPGASVEATA